jgi:aquaporin related protein
MFHSSISTYTDSMNRFAVFYTGASMNTARSFGPAAVSGFPSPNQWVVSLFPPTKLYRRFICLNQYWVGPFLGSLLGSGFYTILKQFVQPLSVIPYHTVTLDKTNRNQYWKLNPDQAAVDEKKSPVNPVDVAKARFAPQSAGSPTSPDRESTTMTAVADGSGGYDKQNSGVNDSPV